VPPRLRPRSLPKIISWWMSWKLKKGGKYS
jgi:hypothetical protein